jgi:hypothetical protein
MLSLVLAVLRSLATGFHARRHLVLENLALRHQLLVLNRTIKTPALRNSDRLFWAALSAMWARWTKALVIVQPDPHESTGGGNPVHNTVRFGNGPLLR